MHAPGVPEGNQRVRLLPLGYVRHAPGRRAAAANVRPRPTDHAALAPSVEQRDAALATAAANAVGLTHLMPIPRGTGGHDATLAG